MPLWPLEEPWSPITRFQSRFRLYGLDLAELGEEPFRMPTPVEVLTAIGDSLVNAGCILSYDPPTEKGLSVLVKPDVTLIIKCKRAPNPQMLTFTSEVCTGLQVDLRDSLRPLERLINEQSVFEPGAATQLVVDYFREHYGC